MKHLKTLKIFLFKFSFIIALMSFFYQPVFSQEKEDGFTFGGAIRYNIYAKSWVENKTQPEFTWDTWRLNVDGSKAGIDLSFEYRFYPTFATHFIHHGYLGYAFNDNLYMKLGVCQVPFGITKYASHSWWFQIPYYNGLEDDYDAGIRFDYTRGDNFELNLAYFRQAEPEGPIFGGVSTFGASGPGRYSYDITPGTGEVFDETLDTVRQVNASIRELNQFNVKAAYTFNDKIEIGLSGQVGGIYNSVLDEAEVSYAVAGHVLANVGNLNFKGEIISYDYASMSDDGEELDVIQMGAYGTPYNVATKANMYVAGLAYSFNVNLGPISSIQAYLDYSMVDKANENFEPTHHFVPGFLISAGGIYTYVDYAMGQNQPWLTDSFGTGLGAGVADADWYSRFNINIGYYF